MKMYLVRHGQTDWNVQRKVQGIADIALNDTGILQASETSKKLVHSQIDLIICSPLKRAMQTAQIINAERNIPIIYDERISERDYGEMEGKYRDDFDFKGFWSYKKNIKYETAENIQDFFKRVYNFLDDITVKYKDMNILLVNHSGVSIIVDCYFNGIPSDDDLLKLVAKNAEIKEYDVKIKEIDDSER